MTLPQMRKRANGRLRFDRDTRAKDDVLFYERIAADNRVKCEMHGFRCRHRYAVLECVRARLPLESRLG